MEIALWHRVDLGERLGSAIERAQAIRDARLVGDRDGGREKRRG